VPLVGDMLLVVDMSWLLFADGMKWVVMVGCLVAPVAAAAEGEYAGVASTCTAPCPLCTPVAWVLWIMLGCMGGYASVCGVLCVCVCAVRGHSDQCPRAALLSHVCAMLLRRTNARQGLLLMLNAM
jgi:hypothetical protein